MAARVALDDAVQVRILAPQFVTIPCKIGYFVRSERYRAGMPRKRRYDEAQVREAVASSASLSQALTKLGLRPAGGNHRTLKKLIEQYGIATAHLDPNWSLRAQRRRTAIPLAEILTECSDYHRGHLKRRLYEAGLKERKCELCGLGENWRGGHMALILDHINGVANDNRLENLRIVCPNCAATLETHCGRKNKLDVQPRACLHCGGEFIPQVRVASVLLTDLRDAQQGAKTTKARDAQSGPTDLRTADAGRRDDELPGDRAQIRSVGQGRPEVDSLV